MIVPILFAVLGLGSIGYGLYEASQVPHPPPPPPGKPMPPELLAAVTALLQTGTDPAAMDTMANNLDSYGYKQTADELRVRAMELRKAQASGQPPPPPAPLFTSSMPGLTPATPTAAAELTATLTGSTVNMRTAPSTTAGIVTQLNKPEVVKVLSWNAGASGGYTFAQVKRSNGQAGFVARNYLSLNGPAPAGVSGTDLAFAGSAEENTAPRPGKCVAPSGCRLRVAPAPNSPFQAIVANGERVMIMKQVPGMKAERMSPGPGGWSLVRYGKRAGWVPSEWLLA